MNGRWSGKALFTVCAWGASFVATRIALVSFTPLGLVALRMTAAALVLGGAGIAARRKLLPGRADLSGCLFLGMILGAHQLIQAVGLQYTSAIHAGWLIAFTPIPIAFGAWLFLKQRLTGAAWIGVGVAASGIFLIVLSTTPGFLAARTGDYLQLLSSLTWTAYTLAGAGLVRRNGALRVNVPATASGAALLLLAASLGGFTRSVPGPPALLALLFLGVVCGGAGYYLWYKALDEHGAARVGSYLYLEPFVTVIVAAALLGEPIRVAVIAGGVLVLLGVWRVARGGTVASAAAAAE